MKDILLLRSVTKMNYNDFIFNIVKTDNRLYVHVYMCFIYILIKVVVHMLKNYVGNLNLCYEYIKIYNVYIITHCQSTIRFYI